MVVPVVVVWVVGALAAAVRAADVHAKTPYQEIVARPATVIEAVTAVEVTAIEVAITTVDALVVAMETAAVAAVATLVANAVLWALVVQTAVPLAPDAIPVLDAHLIVAGRTR